jgi:hypothetical protein
MIVALIERLEANSRFWVSHRLTGHYPALDRVHLTDEDLFVGKPGRKTPLSITHLV